MYNYHLVSTVTLKNLLLYRIGYRNDNLSTGHYKINDVIHHEINELGNEDIIETCKIFYGTDDVYAVINRHFGEKQLWGLWLTTEDGVISNYNGDSEFYDSYKIPDNALVISDLGDEGALFVIDVYPSSLLL